jgi:hypothetical protein
MSTNRQDTPEVKAVEKSRQLVIAYFKENPSFYERIRSIANHQEQMNEIKSITDQICDNNQICSADSLVKPRVTKLIRMLLLNSDRESHISEDKITTSAEDMKESIRSIGRHVNMIVRPPIELGGSKKKTRRKRRRKSTKRRSKRS